MKGLENFTDVMAIIIGMVGALLKGLKMKVKLRNLVTCMVIAGILTFGVSGVIEMFYHDISPKLVILISFIVGWASNELTEKIDLLVDDIYEYLKVKLKSKGNE
ncbi:MAG: hypothetical protein ACYTAN_18000 [Planctomycetota bacterium]|jgi:hypothetical protein